MEFYTGKEDHVTVKTRPCFGCEGGVDTEEFSAGTITTFDEIGFTTEDNDEATLQAKNISCGTPRLDIMTAGCIRDYQRPDSSSMQ